MKPHICVHAHFYQPPRENPWIEEIELQDSADPWHDWNERVTAECYAPNAFSRILDGEGRITRIVNNYSRISFNVGPTLLAWLEAKTPDVYGAILEADRESRKRFGGHGSAIAQAYNHLILPLANRRDKETQVRWGIADFRKRFGRDPEGMWLPETAVDLETLQILAAHGIKFTILAPHQAKKVRWAGKEIDVSGGKIDPTRSYRARGADLALFFYDGPISRGIAFEGLLSSGEELVRRLLHAPSGNRPQLVHIATDGESYGHHHRFGDMALAYALNALEPQLTNYGQYLTICPPQQEVEIVEPSSWSCPHGVERWRSDCGCRGGPWRAPLREALDALRDELAPRFESEASWEERDAYVEVILDRSKGQELPLRKRKLLEMQRHAMLMYTSCGWFFDDLSGIETVQVIQYAARAIQLAEELFGEPFAPRFLERLSKAPDGRRVWDELVAPARVDLPRVGAHYAMTSLFEEDADRIHCYRVEKEEGRAWSAGRARLSVGRAKITCEITGDEARLTFGVLHLGDHVLQAGVRADDFAGLVEELGPPFERADFAEVTRILDRRFGPLTYSLKTLFRDPQRRILSRIVASTVSEAEALYRQIYDRTAPLMRFIASTGVPLPRALSAAGTLVINANLREALEQDPLDAERIRSILDEARQGGVVLEPAAAFALQRGLERRMARLLEDPADPARLEAVAGAVEIAAALPFAVNLWQAQNGYFALLQRTEPGNRSEAFRKLGERLRVKVD